MSIHGGDLEEGDVILYANSQTMGEYLGNIGRISGIEELKPGNKFVGYKMFMPKVLRVYLRDGRVETDDGIINIDLTTLEINIYRGTSITDRLKERGAVQEDIDSLLSQV